MDDLGEDLLASAALSGNQDGKVGIGYPDGDLQGSLQVFGIADDTESLFYGLYRKLCHGCGVFIILPKRVALLASRIFTRT